MLRWPALFVWTCMCLTGLHAEDAPKASAAELTEWADHFADPHDPKRWAYHDKLVEVGLDALPALRAELKKPEPRFRQAALELLQDLAGFDTDWKGQDTELAKDLSELLRHDPSAVIRGLAAGTLWIMKGRASVAIPALLEGLADADDGVAKAAVFALGDIGPAALPPLYETITAQAGRSNSVRLRAALALGRTHPLALESLKYLLPLLNDPYEEVREAAVDALPNSFEETNGAFEYLIGLIKEDGDLAGPAALALGKELFGSLKHDGTELLDALNSKHANARTFAALAVFAKTRPIAGSNIEPTATFIKSRTALLSVLEDADPATRYRAVVEIEKYLVAFRAKDLGQPMQCAAAQLQWLLGDPSSAVRNAACNTLQRLDRTQAHQMAWAKVPVSENSNRARRIGNRR